MERSKAERNSRREMGREHGRSSYQHTLDTFINARRATGIRWRSIRISCVRQAAKQRVKCSSFSHLPSFCLALLCLAPALAHPRSPSRMLRVATAKVKTFRSGSARACKTTSRRQVESTRLLDCRKNSVPLMTRRQVDVRAPSLCLCAFQFRETEG